MKRRKEKNYTNIIIQGFILLCIGAFIWSVHETVEVSNRAKEQEFLERNLEECQKAAQGLMNGSDYLTSNAWHFIATQNRSYMDAYWKEVEEVKTREKAIEQLNHMQLNKQEEKLLIDAKHKSDALIEKEAWAMRMLAEGMDFSYAQMPVRIQNVQLTTQEEALSNDAKKELAINYIFGNEYAEYKADINNTIHQFKVLLLNNNIVKVKDAAERTQHSILITQISYTISLLTFLTIVLIFYRNVIIPFKHYNKRMKDLHKETSNIPLKEEGTKEMKKFAHQFNELYADWKYKNDHLRSLNEIDNLTGLPNRIRLDRYMVSLMHDEHTQNMAVLMIDVDALKSYNDMYGHAFGDKVLAKMGDMLLTMVPEDRGMAGRLSGDEFIIVMFNVTAMEVDAFANHILEMMRNMHFKHEHLPVTDSYLTCSIGSTIWRHGSELTIKEIVHQADLALFQAKKYGRNQHVVFNENDYTFIQLDHEHEHDAQMEAEMIQALHNGEFEPYFQPKFSVVDHHIVSAEALVRWKHPQKGLLYPDYFIPLFERNGFVTELDLYIFERVCAYLKEWKEKGLPLVTIACNFSRLHFQKGHLSDTLKRIIERYDVEPSQLEVEVTEGILIDNAELIGAELKRIRDMGFHIAIDDFGVGYSSLGILQELPVDVVKLDRSFLQRDLSNHKNVMMISGILFIANTLKLSVVCEGVETKEHVELLQKIGCPIAQGFYYSKPVDKDSFIDALKVYAVDNDKTLYIKEAFILIMNILFTVLDIEKVKTLISDDFYWKDTSDHKACKSKQEFITYYYEFLSKRIINYQLESFEETREGDMEILQGEMAFIVSKDEIVTRIPVHVFAYGNQKEQRFYKIVFTK